MRPRRACLADSHALTRSGLRAILDGLPGIEVIGEFEDGTAAVGMIHELNPDVFILNTALPRLSGVETIRRVLHVSPSVRIVAYSPEVDQGSAVEALRAGAAAYISPNSSAVTLREAIHTALTGGIFISPDIAGSVIRSLARTGTDPESRLATLTAREREVMQQLAEGRSNQEIGASLGISHKTVEAHRLRVLHKLDAKNLVELTHIAIRAGLVQVRRAS